MLNLVQGLTNLIVAVRNKSEISTDQATEEVRSMFEQMLAAAADKASGQRETIAIDPAEFLAECDRLVK